MWFKLTSETPKGTSVLYYENITNELRKETGEPLVPNLPKKEDTPLDFSPEKSSCVKSLSVEHLEIVLGLKCNFDCEYCSQKAIRNKGNDMTPERAKLFLEHIRRVGLKVSRSIQLWGGEPLVYKKAMMVLVPGLRELYPDVSISMPSNGSLLTDELIDFFEKYKVSFYVSTDGAPSTKRGQAVEEDPKLNALFCKAAKRLGKRFGFSTTPHQGTANSEKIIRFLRKKVPDVGLIGTHNVVRCHRAGFIPDHVFTMTEEQKAEYSDSIITTLLDENLRKIDRPLNKHAEGFMYRLLNQYNNLAIPGECSMATPKALIIDWEGNTYSCHSHTALEEMTGNIDDIEHVNNIGFTHWTRRKNCPACPFLASCSSGCPRMDKVEHELSCPNMIALHSGIFRAVFIQLFGFEITRIEPGEPPKA